MTQYLSFCLYIPPQWIKQSQRTTFIFIVSGFPNIRNLLIRGSSDFLESICIFSCSNLFGHMADEELIVQVWSVLILCQDQEGQIKLYQKTPKRPLNFRTQILWTDVTKINLCQTDGEERGLEKKRTVSDVMRQCYGMYGCQWNRLTVVY